VETRDVDVTTEEIFMKDKGMQFTYGDDTQLFDIIRAVKERREARSHGLVLTGINISCDVCQACFV
jgi:hypothetical protein